jgi:hypothetical protein
MTQEEAMRLTNDNMNLINKKVKYQKVNFLVNQFVIDKVSENDYIVKIALSPMPAIELLEDFNIFNGNFSLLS